MKSGGWSGGLVACAFLMMGTAAWAGTSDVREIARLNNCTPKKIEAVQQSFGQTGRTVYRVDCNLAVKGEGKGGGASSLLVACDGDLCQLLRAVSGDAK